MSVDAIKVDEIIDVFGDAPIGPGVMTALNAVNAYREARTADEKRDAIRAFEAAIENLDAGGDVMPWTLSEDFEYVTTVMARTAEEAMAEFPFEKENYDTTDGPLLINHAARSMLTGRYLSKDVVLPMKVPPCAPGQEHDWRAPVSVVGGSKENAGVFAGTVHPTTHEVCACCGIYRTTGDMFQIPGQQFISAVQYGRPDRASLDYVESIRGEQSAPKP